MMKRAAENILVQSSSLCHPVNGCAQIPVVLFEHQEGDMELTWILLPLPSTAPHLPLALPLPQKHKPPGPSTLSACSPFPSSLLWRLSSSWLSCEILPLLWGLLNLSFPSPSLHPKDQGLFFGGLFGNWEGSCQKLLHVFRACSFFFASLGR